MRWSSPARVKLRQARIPFVSISALQVNILPGPNPDAQTERKSRTNGHQSWSDGLFARIVVTDAHTGPLCTSIAERSERRTQNSPSCVHVPCPKRIHLPPSAQPSSSLSATSEPPPPIRGAAPGFQQREQHQDNLIQGSVPLAADDGGQGVSHRDRSRGRRRPLAAASYRCRIAARHDSAGQRAAC